jgi:predicted nucleotidyltransferase
VGSSPSSGTKKIPLIYSESTAEGNLALKLSRFERWEITQRQERCDCRHVADRTCCARYYHLMMAYEEKRARACKARRHRAEARAKQVLHLLQSQQVNAAVVGSMADGTFHLYSDVDFLIFDCHRALKYAIESDIEDIMVDIPFDVAYHEEVAVFRRRHMQASAKFLADFAKT